MENEKLLKEIKALDYEEIRCLKSACLVFSEQARETVLKPIFDRFNELYEEREANGIA